MYNLRVLKEQIKIHFIFVRSKINPSSSRSLYTTLQENTSRSASNIWFTYTTNIDVKKKREREKEKITDNYKY